MKGDHSYCHPATFLGIDGRKHSPRLGKLIESGTVMDFTVVDDFEVIDWVTHGKLQLCLKFKNFAWSRFENMPG